MRSSPSDRARARRALLAACCAAIAACTPPAGERPLPGLVGELAPDSALVGCDRADERIVLAASAHLDPACTYTKGVEIRASDVVLDCRGARIEDAAGTERRGVLVAAPVSEALANVTVRNCVVAGFLNGVRVTRDGFKTLAAGAEYENAFSNVVVENTHIYRTRGSGVFVDGYVTGVTLRGLDVADAGSVGVYLEAGSRGNAVERSTLRHNGYGDVVPEGLPFSLAGVPYRYRSTGREAIAIDGSRDNVVSDNVIEGSSAGGIFLYKNCGEYATERPAQWWTRRYGADGNRIERNWIRNERTGVWIGSRMAENQLFMDCSDPAYVSSAFQRIHRDFAAGNAVVGNTFTDVGWGVRIEDDASRVEDNAFFSGRAGAQAVVLGSRYRTTVLGEPVADAVIAGNGAVLAGNAQPYRWIHGHVGTAFQRNFAYGASANDGAEVPLVEGTQPRIDPFLFVVEFWPEP